VFAYHKMQHLAYWGDNTFIRFASVMFDDCMETVPGLRVDHGDGRAVSTFSLPFGHGLRLVVGTAEYHQLLGPPETYSPDSIELTLSTRNNLCRIYNAVGGDAEVMGAIQVIGIVGTGE